MSQLGRGRAHAIACPPNRPLQTLPGRIAVLAVLLLSFLPAATSQAATYTFTAVADTYTRSDAASTNYGSNSRLSERYAKSQRRHAYLRFNVALLAGERITGATLKTYSTTSGANVDLRDVASNTWSESGVTWNSAPAFGCCRHACRLLQQKPNSVVRRDEDRDRQRSGEHGADDDVELGDQPPFA